MSDHRALECLIAGMESRGVFPAEDTPLGYVRAVLDHVDRLTEQRDGGYAHLPTDADWEQHDARVRADERRRVAEETALIGLIGALADVPRTRYAVAKEATS